MITPPRTPGRRWLEDLSEIVQALAANHERFSDYPHDVGLVPGRQSGKGRMRSPDCPRKVANKLDYLCGDAVSRSAEGRLICCKSRHSRLASCRGRHLRPARSCTALALDDASLLGRGRRHFSVDIICRWLLRFIGSWRVGLSRNSHAAIAHIL